MQSDTLWLRAPVALALILAVVALALRLHGLGDKPLWLDEIITFERANRRIADLITGSLKSKHFPTYFLLVRPFDGPVIDEWMLRLPSAILGAIAVFLATLVATHARSLRAGLVAGLLMALSPFEVQFSQEARSYTLVSAFILLALWGLVRIGRRPQASAVALHRRGGLAGSWAAYTIGTIGALDTQVMATPWLAAATLGFAVIAWRAGSARRGLVRNWLLIQAVILLAWLPALAAIVIKISDDPLRGLGWIPDTTWHHLQLVVSAVYLFRISDLTTFALLPAPIPGFGLLVVVMVALGAWTLKSDRNAAAVIGLAALAMPASLVLISIFHSFVVPRYLMWGTGAFFVLAGIGADALPRRIYPWTAATLALGAGLSLAPYYRADTKPRWDLAVAYLAAHARPDDALITNDGTTAYVIASYAGRFRLDRAIFDQAHGVADATPRFAQGKRVWAVYGRTGQGQIDSARDYVAKLTPLGTPTSQVRFPPNILVLLFDPAGSTSRSGTGKTAE